MPLKIPVTIISTSLYVGKRAVIPSTQSTEV